MVNVQSFTADHHNNNNNKSKNDGGDDDDGGSGGCGMVMVLQIKPPIHTSNSPSSSIHIRRSI